MMILKVFIYLTATRILMDLLVYFKVLFILILFVIFLVFFGIPSMIEFQDDGVFIKVSKYYPSDGAVPAPAATICAENPVTGIGWKSAANTSTSAESLFETACEGLDGDALLP